MNVRREQISCLWPLAVIKLQIREKAAAWKNVGNLKEFKLNIDVNVRKSEVMSKQRNKKKEKTICIMYLKQSLKSFGLLKSRPHMLNTAV